MIENSIVKLCHTRNSCLWGKKKKNKRKIKSGNSVLINKYSDPGGIKVIFFLRVFMSLYLIPVLHFCLTDCPACRHTISLRTVHSRPTRSISVCCPELTTRRRSVSTPMPTSPARSQRLGPSSTRCFRSSRRSPSSRARAKRARWVCVCVSVSLSVCLWTDIVSQITKTKLFKMLLSLQPQVSVKQGESSEFVCFVCVCVCVCVSVCLSVCGLTSSVRSPRQNSSRCSCLSSRRSPSSRARAKRARWACLFCLCVCVCVSLSVCLWTDIVSQITKTKLFKMLLSLQPQVSVKQSESKESKLSLSVEFVCVSLSVCLWTDIVSQITKTKLFKMLLSLQPQVSVKQGESKESKVSLCVCVCQSVCLSVDWHRQSDHQDKILQDAPVTPAAGLRQAGREQREQIDFGHARL